MSKLRANLVRNDDEIEIITQWMTDHPALQEDTGKRIPIYLGEELLTDIDHLTFWQFVIAKWVETDADGHFHLTAKAVGWATVQRLTDLLASALSCCECEKLGILDENYKCRHCRG